jgi:hypothetical protein
VGRSEIGNVEAKLQKPEFYRPTALTVATYCQSDQNLFPQILSYAWLPGEVSHLGEPWCEVSSNFAHVEFGGGFYHFGYSLKLDKAAFVSATNVWKLFLAREEQPDKLLMILPLASTQHMEAADLVNLLRGSFDQIIKNNQPGGYKGKVMAQLRFGLMRQAAITCENWIKAKPDSWLARFTYAHICCRLGEAEAADNQFKDWVNIHQSFGNDIYLALFDFRERRTNQAIEAVHLALGQPLVESPNEGANIFYLAYNGAMIAYVGGDFDLCISICDKMLPNNSYNAKAFRRNALRIKAAAMLMKGKQTAATDLMKQAEADNENDPFSHDIRTRSDRKLGDAIRKNDIQFVRNLGNWADEMETWFSPYSTDESGWHGSNLGVPTPYPTSWKTDLINTNTP